ncbi:MAG: hypothetical protein V1761_02080, partial [bacterium]
GLARGFKKSLYTFITMAIFYAVFFLTLNAAVTFLWTMNTPFIGTALGYIDSSLSGYTSFESAMTPLFQFFAGDALNLSGANTELTGLLLGMGMFVVKIVYMVLYFTVGLLVYKLLCGLIRLIFIHQNKGAAKNRLLGGVFGLANGAVALFVFFIMMGGLVNILSSVTSMIPGGEATPLSQPIDRPSIYEASQTILPLAEGDGQGLTDAVAAVEDIVTAYESNSLVQLANLIQITSGSTEVPLSLYLFDQVVSFEYEGQTIALRRELAVVATVAGTIFEALDAAGIDINNMEGVDFALIIGAIGSVDLTMLMDSQLITTALIYVLSGEAGVEGLDMIVVPEGIEWYDTLDDEGNIIEAGELRNLLNALNAIVDIAGSIDFDNIDFTVVTTLSDDAIDALFASQILTATISVAITSMTAGDMTLVIPDTVFDENGYILKEEMVAMVDAVQLVVETVGTDPENFDFGQALSLDASEVDILLASQILSATIGKMIADMTGDPLVVPTTVLEPVAVGDIDVDVVGPEEIAAVFASLSVLDIQSFDGMTFDAGILANLEGSTPGELSDAKLATLFGSDILRATMSNMIITATAEAGSILTIPYYDAAGDAIRESLGGYVVITVEELGNVLKALYALDIEDFANFNSLDPSVLLAKIPTMLQSAILHATISNQILSMTGDMVNVPYWSGDGTETVIRISVGDGIEATEYIAAAELTSVIAALDVLTIDNPATFDGTVSLSFFSDPEDRAIILDSAIMHATLSGQMLNLGSGLLTVPMTDVDGLAVREYIGPVGHQTEFVSIAEIDAIFDALVVLNTGDIGDISGAFTLSDLGDEADQDALLASASMHATISKTLLDFGSAILIVPDYDADGVGAGNRVKVTRGSTVYIRKTEVKALINAFMAMGFTEELDFSSGFDSALFFAEADTILESASLQATISDMLINGTGGNLLIPDEDVENGDSALRVTVPSDGVEYVVKSEILAILASLDILGLTDFGTMDITIGTLFTGTLDFAALIDSASVQATISHSLLAAPTKDETTMVAGQADLIVPTALRQDITIAGVGDEQIIDSELVELLTALRTLGFVAYGESMDGSAITGLSNAQITTLLESGSIHVTIYNMLLANGAIDIPDLAKEAILYGIVGITKDFAIVNFINAVRIIGAASFTTAAFSIDAFDGLTEDDRDAVLVSMIVRNTLTPQFEALDALDPFYTIEASDYMENNTSLFLTAEGIVDYLNYLP